MISINVHIRDTDQRTGAAFNGAGEPWGSYRLNEYVSVILTPDQARAIAAELAEFAAFVDQAAPAAGEPATHWSAA